MTRSDFEKNFAKAIQYDYLAQHHKYANPELHIKYYKKHLHYLAKALKNQQDDRKEISEQPGAIRILHGASETDAIDIYVNGSKTFQDVSYPHVTNYLSLPAGTYFIDIYPANTQIHSLQSRKIIVSPEKMMTIAFAGGKASEKLIPYKDRVNAIDGNAKLRFIHLMKDTGPIDVQVKNSECIHQKVPYRTATNYIGFKPADLEFEIINHLTKEVLLTLPSMSLVEDHQCEIYLTGSKNTSAGLSYLIAD